MAPIVKGRGSQTGDKTLMGDAHLAWKSVIDDEDHGHFLVLVYDDVSDALKVFKSGCNKPTHSAHDVVADEMKALAEIGLASWCGYSWKAVQNLKPGQKLHQFKTAVCLCTPKNCRNLDKIRQIKNRVRDFVFTTCDLYQEIKDPSYIDDPDWWMRKRAVNPPGTRHSDFGGGHVHAQEDCAHAQFHTELAEGRARAQIVSQATREDVHQLCMDEQQRRSDLWRRAEKVAIREREKNRAASIKAIEEEKARRVKEQGPHPSNNHEQFMNRIRDDLLSHDAGHHQERSAKRASRASVHEQALDRQRELTREWHAKTEESEQLRKSNGALCKRILDAEQRRRSTSHEEEYIKSAMAKEFSGSIKHELVEAHEIMERGVNQRGAKLAMDQEKRERCSETRFASPKVARQKSMVLSELTDTVRFVN